MQSNAAISIQPSNVQNEFQIGKDIHTFQRYLSYVRKIAKGVHATTNGYLDIDDLISAGIYGLYQATLNYDASYGIPFLSYCHFRIRGEMYDDLRRNDWIPRQVRKQNIQCQQAETKLQAQLCRKPTSEELVHETDLDHKTIDEFLKSREVPKMFSYHRASSDDNSDYVECVHFIDNRSIRPQDLSEKEDSWKSLIHCLNRTEKLVLTFYYREELTMNQIGILLGISESRICQIHGQALKRLRAFREENYTN